MSILMLQTLCKVITTVLKFSDEQSRKILEKEETKVSVSLLVIYLYQLHICTCTHACMHMVYLHWLLSAHGEVDRHKVVQ